MTAATPSPPLPPVQIEGGVAKRLVIPAGPADGPPPPFPLHVGGPVVKGFGRGSKELHIPTANIPVEGLAVGHCETVESGVYFGWAGLDLDSLPDTPPTTPLRDDDGTPRNVFPMVMSIGWNPFYKNKVRSVEVHIMHPFKKDFYGVQMKLSILGYIRPELDYVSREALIKDIHTDIAIARLSLERETYAKYRNDEWLRTY